MSWAPQDLVAAMKVGVKPHEVGRFLLLQTGDSGFPKIRDAFSKGDLGASGSVRRPRGGEIAKAETLNLEGFQRLARDQ